MLPPSQDCLHNFGLWTMCFRRMCAPWDTKHRDGTYSSQPCIPFIEAIGAPFPRSSRHSCINSGMGCTIELRTSPEAGDYHSHSSSRICSGRRGSKVLRKKGITEHPQFGQIQWNQSYLHMPREHRARALDEPEMMNMDEPAVAEPG
jgi:hypothetical protein